MSNEYKLSTPKFQVCGYAIFESCRHYQMPDGSDFPFYSGTIVGIKPDAPQWAKDEYEEWKKFKEQTKKEMIEY